MLRTSLVICMLIGASFAREDNHDQSSAEATNNAKREAPLQQSYGPPADKEPAPVYGPPSHSSGSVQANLLYKSAHSPQSYSKSIPAAAIRNVETVAVTKTITPVVTKTTTYNTHSEPALSVGHVQGYSQAAIGQPKIAPVQFQTQYTSYHNPTVGVNGPVTYTGPAVVFGNGYAVPISLNAGAFANSGSIGLSSAQPAPVYGAPAESAPATGYGAPGQSAGSPLGSYSMNIPQFVSFRPSAAPMRPAPAPQYQRNQLALGSSPVQMSLRPPNQISRVPNRYSLYQQHQIIAAASARQPTFYQLPPQQPLQHLHSPRHHYQQQVAQPSVQFVQTYAAPSISFTRVQPVHDFQRQAHQQQISSQSQ